MTVSDTYIYVCIHAHINMYKISLVCLMLSEHHAGKQRLSPEVILEITKFSKTLSVSKNNSGKHQNMVGAFILQTLVGIEYLVYEHTF